MKRFSWSAFGVGFGVGTVIGFAAMILIVRFFNLANLADESFLSWLFGGSK